MQLTLGLPESGTALALGPGATLLRGLAAGAAEGLLGDVGAVLRLAPLRHMVTPGGFRMSVAMTNCGALGWVSDARGYRYTPIDPDTGAAWPAMPPSFLDLARAAAERGGFDAFTPDACLVNRYETGARLALHQDKDERDYEAPIVSVSLGLPATFLFGGDHRAHHPQRVLLGHGDVVVWGGPSRLRYHGVAPLEEGLHPRVGPHRINLTLRKAG